MNAALVKKYLLTGLMVWLPLAITLWVLLWLLGVMDGLFSWVLAGATAVLPGKNAHMGCVFICPSRRFDLCFGGSGSSKKQHEIFG